MKKILITILLFICAVNHIFATDTLTVADITDKINSGKPDTLFYGFESGDKVLINFEMASGAEIKLFTVYEVRGNVIFQKFKTSAINTQLTLNHKQVLGFVINHSGFIGKVYRVHIQRIPAKAEAKMFNTSVVMRPSYDTVFSVSQAKVFAGYDTIFDPILNQKTRVHSLTSINLQPNRVVIPINLPPNTDFYTFWIGVGDEGQKSYNEAAKMASKSLTGVAGFLPGYGPLIAYAVNGALALSIHNQGDNVLYWITTEKEDAEKFMADKEEFKFFKSGNIVQELGKVNSPNKNKNYYLCLKNDNIRDGIDVDIKIIAVSITPKYITKDIKKALKINYRGIEPFHVN